MKTAIMRHFQWSHLPTQLADVSKPVCELAIQIEGALGDGPEKSAGLRKLMEAKDCFVRQALEDLTKGTTPVKP